MQDYNPSVFRRSNGEILAAWAVCVMLYAGILLGTFINSSADLDEHKGSVVPHNISSLVQTGVPEHKIATSSK